MNEATEVVRPGRWHVVDGVVNWVEGHAKELCDLCGVHPIPGTATAFSCEHGSWALTDPEPAPVIVAPSAPHSGDLVDPPAGTPLTPEGLAAVAPAGDETGDGKTDEADTAVLPADAPAKRASKAEWATYAVTRYGMTQLDADATSKEALILLLAKSSPLAQS